MKKNINNVKEAKYEEKTESIYLIDNPCDESEDSIGFETYVNNLLNIILNSSAKMIGLISDYGSGKSTIINMIEKRKELQNDEVFFVKVNLWNLPSKTKQKNEDITISIHKSFLNQILRKSSINNMKKKSLEKQINKNYGFLDLSVEDTNFSKFLFILFALLIFIVISKVDLFDLNIPRIALLILKSFFSFGLAHILIKSKIYFSFNKESKNTRNIDEFETTECFIKLMDACKENKKKKIIICIEDIDRFTDGNGTIRFLEQIYKFYSESIMINDIDIKFIVSIKPASKIKVEKLNESDEIKNLYEKIFDYIISLQPVAIQNYDSMIQELLSGKVKQLQKINLPLPTNIEATFYQYLYKGKKNTIRDIKHRYNYAINLYENLLKNKENSENVEINIDTCFYIAYLEDEFSDSYYKLISDSEKFEKMVINKLTKNKLLLCDKCTDHCEISSACPYFKEKDFISEIERGFNKKYIDMNYSMYFYKLPKTKKIKNVFDSKVNNIILTDNTKECIKNIEYIEKASEKEIKESLRLVVSENVIPSVVLNNKRIFNIAYDNYKTKLEKYVSSIKLNEQENKVINMIIQLSLYDNNRSKELLDKVIDNVVDNFKISYEEQDIINFRRRILFAVKKYPNICEKIYSPEITKISYEEMCIIADINKILHYINPEQIDEKLIDNILKFNGKEIKVKVLCDFLEKSISIDDVSFEEILYGYKYNFSSKEKYTIINNDQIIKKLKLDTEKKYLKFFSHFEIIPANLEVNFTSILKKNNNIEYEKEYVNLINSTNQISTGAIKYFQNLKKRHYCFTEGIEEIFYQKKCYEVYVYSKTNRTKKFELDIPERIENLKSAYVYYFEHSDNILKNITISNEMAEYLKSNVDIKSLTVERRCLLNVLDQSLEDVKEVLSTENEQYINKYLQKINKFVEEEQMNILNKIYSWAKKTHQLNESTYEKLKIKFKKECRKKFGTLKRLKYLSK